MAREKENKGVKSYADQSKAKTNFNKAPAEKKAPKPRPKPAQEKKAPKPKPKPESVKAKGYKRKADLAGGPRKSAKKTNEKQGNANGGNSVLGQGRASPASPKMNRRPGFGNKAKGPAEVTVRRKDAKGYRSKTAR